MTRYLALYNFGIFKAPADSPDNEDWHLRHDPIMAHVATVDGFVARSGYEGEEGPDSWGTQVYPRFFQDNGDGWSPATLSLWRGLEPLYHFTYSGLHKEAYIRGKRWFRRGEWPPYVLWWIDADHRPVWSEGVERFEHLHDNGPTEFAFNFKQPYDSRGNPTKLHKG